MKVHNEIIKRLLLLGPKGRGSYHNKAEATMSLLSKLVGRQSKPKMEDMVLNWRK
jgi:hypothetical protein